MRRVGKHGWYIGRCRWETEKGHWAMGYDKVKYTKEEAENGK